MNNLFENNLGRVYDIILGIWSRYMRYIRSKLWKDETYTAKDMVYWQNELFIKIAAITLPAGIIVLIPSVLIAWVNGSALIAYVNILTLLSISYLILATSFSIKWKMGISVTILTAFGVFLIATLGSFGLGSLYLLAISVLISILFSYRVAFFSVFINALIYGVFALLIYTKYLDLSLTTRFTLDVWLTYSINFLFLNLIVVVEIRHILNGLQKTIEQEEYLLKKLQLELEAKIESSRLLADSEGHYKSLFVHNPLPMWIFDPQSLKFLQVNEAAVSKYGYTDDEFHDMTIQQIRVESTEMIAESLQRTLNEGSVFSNVALHQKKNGKTFYAKVRCSTIPYKGKVALLVIANDITTQISHTEAIENQNNKLKNIAYLQSHTMRAPLAKIMGLWNLLEMERENVFDDDFYHYLQSSLNELDDVIKQIIKDSAVVEPQNSQKEKLNP